MKKVVQNKTEKVVNTQDCSEDMIYVFKNDTSFYKLQRVDDDLFAFCNLNNSFCWANGRYEFLNMIEITVESGYDVYELESIEELAEFLKG